MIFVLIQVLVSYGIYILWIRLSAPNFRVYNLSSYIDCPTGYVENSGQCVGW